MCKGMKMTSNPHTHTHTHPQNILVGLWYETQLTQNA